jgi:hypothetical protein
MRRIILMATALGLLAVVPLALGESPKLAKEAKAAHHFAGAVTAVNADSLSVTVLWTGKNDTQLLGKSETVTVNAQTKITAGREHKPVALSSIHPGDLIGLGVTSAGTELTSLTAVRIHVSCNCHWVGGTISSVGSSTLVVHVLKTGPFDRVLKNADVTLQLSSSTLYVKGKEKKQVSIGDLKVGDRVGVIFAASGFFKAPSFNAATATFTATRVHDWGAKKAVPAASTDEKSAATVGI